MGNDNSARDVEIYEARQAGEKGVDLAKKHGLTQGRISQICKRVSQLRRCDTPETPEEDTTVRGLDGG
jgi:Mor family transcriptional regulator